MAHYFHDVPQDLKFALRSLGRQPGLVAAAMLSAALGIGVCSVVFSIINFALLQPLPVEDPLTLMTISGTRRSGSGISKNAALAIGKLPSWDGVAYYFPTRDAALGTPGDVKPAKVGVVSANYFDVARPRFVLGRGFDEDSDDVPGGPAKIVLSHRVWQERYAADESILGKDLIVNGRPMTVVGVTGPGFVGTTKPIALDFFAPRSQIALLSDGGMVREALTDDDRTLFFGVGRLAAGATAAQAQAELDVVSDALQEQTSDARGNLALTLSPAGELLWEAQDRAKGLFALASIMSMLVLLTACANVANLLLARSAMRGPELSTRLALGAGRGRIVRQLLTESVLLASAGGLLGVLLVPWTNLLIARTLASVRFLSGTDFTLAIDYRVVAFAAALCVATGIFFGLLPALRATKPGLIDDLRRGAGASSAGYRRFGLRNCLAATQIAMSAALLLCSGMFLRGFQEFSGVVGGNIDPTGLSVIAFEPALNRYDAEAARGLAERVLREAETVPGVVSASVVTGSNPHVPSERSEIFSTEPKSEPGSGQHVLLGAVTDRFFETLGIRVLDGGVFQDKADFSSVVLADDLAELLFPGRSAVGGTVYDQSGEALTVVGVVQRDQSNPLQTRPTRRAYRSLLRPDADSRVRRLALILKLSPTAPPAALIRRQVLIDLDPNLLVEEARSMRDVVGEFVWLVRLPAILFGACGLMGLIISSIGIYGVMSFAVARRFKEIGIRLALGAQATRVVRGVVSHGAAVALTGVTIGLAGGYGLARVTESFAFGVTAADPVTYAVVAAIIVAVALAASAVPASRAASVNPAETLRSD